MLPRLAANTVSPPYPFAPILARRDGAARPSGLLDDSRWYTLGVNRH